MSIVAWSGGMGVFATLPGADAVLDLGLEECKLNKLTCMYLKGKRSDELTKPQWCKLWDRLTFPERTKWKMFTCQKSGW